MSRSIVPTTEGPFFTGKPLSNGWAAYAPSLESLELGVRVELAFSRENGAIAARNAYEIARRAEGERA